MLFLDLIMSLPFSNASAGQQCAFRDSAHTMGSHAVLNVWHITAASRLVWTDTLAVAGILSLRV